MDEFKAKEKPLIFGFAAKGYFLRMRKYVIWIDFNLTKSCRVLHKKKPFINKSIVNEGLIVT